MRLVFNRDWYKSSTPDLGSEGPVATYGISDHLESERKDRAGL